MVRHLHDAIEEESKSFDDSPADFFTAEAGKGDRFMRKTGRGADVFLLDLRPRLRLDLILEILAVLSCVRRRSTATAADAAPSRMAWLLGGGVVCFGSVASGGTIGRASGASAGAAGTGSPSTFLLPSSIEFESLLKRVLRQPISFVLSVKMTKQTTPLVDHSKECGTVTSVTSCYRHVSIENENILKKETR